jgi:hypothetical protein
MFFSRLSLSKQRRKKKRMGKEWEGMENIRRKGEKGRRRVKTFEIKTKKDKTIQSNTIFVLFFCIFQNAIISRKNISLQMFKKRRKNKRKSEVNQS